MQIAEESSTVGRLVRAGHGRGRRIGIGRGLGRATQQADEEKRSEAVHDPTVAAAVGQDAGVRRRSQPILLAALLAGCAAPVDPPIPYAEPAELSFLTPTPGEVANPVSFAVEAAASVPRVPYVADEWFTLGSSEERDSGFVFGMDFAVLGEHTMTARGFDADGDFVAEAEVAIDVLPDPNQLNQLGAWLHGGVLADPGYQHEEYAERLASVGVKRVYIEGGQGEPDCAAWPDLCDHDVTNLWRARGIEPWVWFRADAGVQGAAQAEMIRDAVTAGYQGIVVDIGAEYADDVDGVQSLLAGMLFVRSQCDTTGLHLGGNFPIYLATPGHPEDQGLPISTLEGAVDGYVPRTDMAVWTVDEQSDPAALANRLICAWSDAGATKPVHHTIDLVLGDLSALDPFLRLSGRETSLYRVPVPDGSDATWADWAAMNWWGGEFEQADCTP